MENFSDNQQFHRKYRKYIQTLHGTLVSSRRSYRNAQNDKAPAGYRQTGALGTRAQGVRAPPAITLFFLCGWQTHGTAQTRIVQPKNSSYPVAGRASGDLNGPSVGAIFSLT